MNNRGNSINNRSWVAGYSNLAGNQSRHAALWRDGALTDLGTLGGPNSAVTSQEIFAAALNKIIRRESDHSNFAGKAGTIFYCVIGGG